MAMKTTIFSLFSHAHAVVAPATLFLPFTTIVCQNLAEGALMAPH